MSGAHAMFGSDAVECGMLFIHPMWDNESQRIGKRKCTPAVYALHAIAEMIGFAGLLIRIIAFVLDNLLATAAFLAVAALKSAHPYVSVGTQSLTYLGYFYLCEALWSRTPGKYLQGLVVVDPSGGRCGWRRALLRTLVRPVRCSSAGSRRAWAFSR